MVSFEIVNIKAVCYFLIVMLYPSVDLMYEAKVLTDIMNNVTQNESHLVVFHD